MSEQNTPGPDPDVEMADAIPEVDQEELFHQKRLELVKSLNTSTSYDWSYLTEDFVENFEEKLDQLIVSAIQSPDTIEDLFREILYSAKYYEDRVSIDKLSAILNGVVETEDAQLYFFKFMSVFNTFKVDDNLIGVLKGFQKLPSKEMAKYLSDDQLLQKLNVVNNYTANKNNYLVSNFVEQRKYNLLFESSEGYAKLMTLLHEVIDSEDSYFQVDYTLHAIERLIGHYTLDPIRVLDVILDIYCNSVLKNYRFCIDLLKKSQWWPTNNESDNSSIENLNKGGNREAALLFGIKLRSYLAVKKDMPETLKCLIGILIKEGFISFGSILKYAGPDEKTMEKLQEEIAKEVDDEIFKASASALALSGPLADDDDEDTSSKPKSKTEQKVEAEKETDTNRNINQKLHLIKVCLTVGLYWPSVYMLTKYPYLVFADKEIIPLILRLFHKIITPLKEQVSLLSASDIEELKTQKTTAFARRTAANDSVTLEDFEYTNIEVFRPLQSNHTNKKFIYFYQEWTNGLPSATDYDDLFHYSAELLAFVGAKLGDDLQLTTLLSRFGVDDIKRSENTDDYEKTLNKWFEYFRKYIFPASTVIVENSVTTHEIFTLLKKFPIQWRYNLYGELVNVISKQNDVVRLNYSKAEKQTKDVLKRITTENVKPMMRRFAKISFANPLPSFLVIVTQVESYDNLSSLVVEAARYFTDYAWDVLPFVLLMRLTARRDFVQFDGMNEAPWLQSLATFIAKLAKSYASMNLNPILTFIIKGLHQNNTMGLTILREIVNQMGGIQQSSNLSANQIQLLNSGESLQRSINKIIYDTREECTKSALRLLNTLINSNELSELFILLCGFHKDLIEKSDESAHYKVLSSQSDEITAVLHTFIELINYFLRNDPVTFKKSNIELSELISKYKVEPFWAFELWRRNIDLEDIQDIDYVNVDFESLDKNLYNTFWKLSLYDINYDELLYTHEKERLSELNTSAADQLARLRKERLTAEVRAQENKLKKERAFNEEIINQIPLDNEAHQAHSVKVKELLEKSAQSWFKEEDDKELEAFFQYCVIQRAVQSETDAIFTGKFVTSVLGFEASQKIIDLFVNSEILDTLIYTITPLEAENLGFFLAEVFKYYEDLRIGGDLSNETKIKLFSWHTKALLSIKINIESENYMSRRNSFTLLKNLIGVYPIVEDHAENIIELIGKVSSTEKRNDLKLASDAILAHIKSRSKKWIHVWDFYTFSDEEKKEVIQKRESLLKEREEKIQEAKRIGLMRQKAQREAEIASRAQSRAESRAESRPESRSSNRPDTGSDLRLRSRMVEKDDDGDISLMENFDKKDEASPIIKKVEISDRNGEAKDTEKTQGSSSIHKSDTESLKEGTTAGDEDDVEEPAENIETEGKDTEEDREEIEETKVEIKAADEQSQDKDEKSNGAGEKKNNEVNPLAERKDRLGNRGQPQRTGAKVTDSYVPSARSTTPSDKSDKNDRVKTKFVDVTAPSRVLKGEDIVRKLRTIGFAVTSGEYSAMRNAIDDNSVENEIIGASKDPKSFRKNLENILTNYAKEIGGVNSQSVQHFLKTVNASIEKFPIPSRPYESKPSTPQQTGAPARQKRPLPPQEAVSGFTNAPTQKWGIDNRTLKSLPSGPSSQGHNGPRRNYNQGYRQDNQGYRQDNQGYRQTSSSSSSYAPDSSRSRQTQSSGARGSVPPPPPPPPRDSSSESSNKRYNNSNQTSYRDKRQRR